MSKAIILVLSIFVVSCSSITNNSLTIQEKFKGWQLLFNGKDFTDWKQDKWNQDCFKIEDGMIKCYGKASMLYYTGKTDYQNFHFIADVKTEKGANSGIFFHTKYQDKGWPIGHEAQVNCSHKDPVKTGSVYIVDEFLGKAHDDYEWFRYEIIVRDKRITTIVNDRVISDYLEINHNKRRKLSSGTFGLQSHDPGSVVYFKNIKVKEL